MKTLNILIVLVCVMIAGVTEVTAEELKSTLGKYAVVSKAHNWDGNDADKMIDGNPETFWYVRGTGPYPEEKQLSIDPNKEHTLYQKDAYIDLGEEQSLCAVKFDFSANDTSGRKENYKANIGLSVLVNLPGGGEGWKAVVSGLVLSGELRHFDTIRAKYIRVRAHTHNASGGDYGVDINITEMGLYSPAINPTQ